MMRKTALILTVMLVLAGLLAAGCGGNNPEAQKVLDKALSNMKKWKSFKIDMKATTTSGSSKSPASNSSATVEVTTEGGTQMHSVIDQSGSKMEQYQIGNTIYAYVEGQGWVKQEATSSDPLNVEIANTLAEGVKDLKMESQSSKGYTLTFMMETKTQPSSSSSAPAENRETRFVVKVDKPAVNITDMKVSASSGSGSNTQTQVQSYKFFDINVPVTITLPEEAKNAKSASELQGSSPSSTP